MKFYEVHALFPLTNNSIPTQAFQHKMKSIVILSLFVVACVLAERSDSIAEGNYVPGRGASPSQIPGWYFANEEAQKKDVVEELNYVPGRGASPTQIPGWYFANEEAQKRDAAINERSSNTDVGRVRG